MKNRKRSNLLPANRQANPNSVEENFLLTITNAKVCKKLLFVPGMLLPLPTR